MLVENSNEQKGVYDFILISHRASIATALGVIYKVVMNTTGISKADF